MRARPYNRPVPYAAPCPYGLEVPYRRFSSEVREGMTQGIHYLLQLRMKTLLAFALSLTLLSCSDNAADRSADPNSGSVHTGATDTIVSSGEPVRLEGCYRMVSGRDTAEMFLNIIGTAVTGKLVYNYFEKDDNNGSIKGELKADRIVADYIFQSEGGTSTREVAFKLQDTVLLEGYGKVAERNGKAIFLEADKLQFNTANPFVKVDCRPDMR
jgi:hypothetical protein